VAVAREPVTPLVVVVLIVSGDRGVVEADLAAGRLVCPRCLAGVLGGWGCSRLREVRTGSGLRRLRPRRGRCRERSCRATHVLLPDVCLARRRYVAEVMRPSVACATGHSRLRSNQTVAFILGHKCLDPKLALLGHPRVVPSHGIRQRIQRIGEFRLARSSGSSILDRSSTRRSTASYVYPP